MPTGDLRGMRVRRRVSALVCDESAQQSNSGQVSKSCTRRAAVRKQCERAARSLAVDAVEEGRWGARRQVPGLRCDAEG